MSKKKIEFQCKVIHETVKICLCKKHNGFMGKGVPWEQCDQEDCQYVDENQPPCPLDVTMFKEYDE